MICKYKDLLRFLKTHLDCLSSNFSKLKLFWNSLITKITNNLGKTLTPLLLMLNRIPIRFLKTFPLVMINILSLRPSKKSLSRFPKQSFFSHLKLLQWFLLPLRQVSKFLRRDQSLFLDIAIARISLLVLLIMILQVERKTMTSIYICHTNNIIEFILNE